VSKADRNTTSRDFFMDSFDCNAPVLHPDFGWM
jgi:hypothetical protein